MSAPASFPLRPPRPLREAFSVSNSLKIAVYFVCTLFLGALLAPPLFWAGHALGTTWGPLHKLAEFEFRRYFDRAMFVAALALLWPAVHALRVGGWQRSRPGTRPAPVATPRLWLRGRRGAAVAHGSCHVGAGFLHAKAGAGDPVGFAPRLRRQRGGGGLRGGRILSRCAPGAHRANRSAGGCAGVRRRAFCGPALPASTRAGCEHRRG